MTTLNTRVVKNTTNLCNAISCNPSPEIVIIPPDFEEPEYLSSSFWYFKASNLKSTPPDKHLLEILPNLDLPNEHQGIEAKIISSLAGEIMNGIVTIFLVDGRNPGNMNLYLDTVRTLEKQTCSIRQALYAHGWKGKALNFDDAPSGKSRRNPITLSNAPIPFAISETGGKFSSPDHAIHYIQWTNRCTRTLGGNWKQTAEEWVYRMLACLKKNYGDAGAVQMVDTVLGASLVRKGSGKELIPQVKQMMDELFSIVEGGSGKQDAPPKGGNEKGRDIEGVKDAFIEEFKFVGAAPLGKLFAKNTALIQNPSGMISDMKSREVDVLDVGADDVPLAFSIRCGSGRLCVIPAYAPVDKFIEDLEKRVSGVSTKDALGAVRDWLSNSTSNDLATPSINKSANPGRKIVFVFSKDNYHEKWGDFPNSRTEVKVKVGKADKTVSMSPVLIARLWCMHYLREKEKSMMAYRTAEKKTRIKFVRITDLTPWESNDIGSLWVSNMSHCISEIDKLGDGLGESNTNINLVEERKKIPDPSPPKGKLNCRELSGDVDLYFQPGEMEYFSGMLAVLKKNSEAQKMVDIVCHLLSSSDI